MSHFKTRVCPTQQLQRRDHLQRHQSQLSLGAVEAIGSSNISSLEFSNTCREVLGLGLESRLDLGDSLGEAGLGEMRIMLLSKFQRIESSSMRTGSILCGTIMGLE